MCIRDRYRLPKRRRRRGQRFQPPAPDRISLSLSFCDFSSRYLSEVAADFFDSAVSEFKCRLVGDQPGAYADYGVDYFQVVFSEGCAGFDYVHYYV